MVMDHIQRTTIATIAKQRNASGLLALEAEVVGVGEVCAVAQAAVHDPTPFMVEHWKLVTY